MSTTEGRQAIEAVDLTGAVWRKASASGGNGGGCVELAEVDGIIALRDSKDPDKPPHLFTRYEIACFIDGAKGGEFDDLAEPEAG